MACKLKIPRCIRRPLFAFLAIGVLFFGFVGIQLLMGNFHAVIPGELYRSAQPDAHAMEHYAKEYGIKSIINLRGENLNAPWYEEEIAAAKALGITHINFRMKASRELTKEQAITLIDLMKNAPKPLLIHCRSGADRTGFAAAIYLAGIAKRGEWESERQLWMHYGHMPFYVGSAYAMDRTFENMEEYFGYSGT